MSDEMRRANTLFRVMNIREYQDITGIDENPLLKKLIESLAHTENLNFDKVDLVVDTAYLLICNLNESTKDNCVELIGGLINE
tara:strand:- start:567 stop:815 length:249 start_codon:yes stop_codon:yes gene_type:complete